VLCTGAGRLEVEVSVMTLAESQLALVALASLCATGWSSRTALHPSPARRSSFRIIPILLILYRVNPGQKPHPPWET
jgi:hypothetical protein